MDRFGALRDAQFRRLFTGQALSSFGDSALYLTLGIWAKTLTGSNAAAGGVFLALAAPTLLAPLAGHLADRMRRKTLLDRRQRDHGPDRGVADLRPVPRPAVVHRDAAVHPPRLQGRVSGAASTLLITPQTLSIAAGAALIGVVSYRLLLLVMAVFIGACAAWLRVHPAPAPDAGPAAATDSPPAAAPPPDRDKDKDDLPGTDMFVPRQAPGKHADLARYDGSSGHGSA